MNDTDLDSVRKKLEEYMAKKAAKRAAAKAESDAKWAQYNEQLAKGNSNIGAGAKRSRIRTKVYRIW